jgi:hypothetical protein
MRYALLICQDENAVFSAEEREARLAAFNAFAEGTEARGILLSGFRLQPTSAATTVRVRQRQLLGSMTAGACVAAVSASS